MPCVSLPAPPVPSLPGGITVAAALPPFSGNIEACCKLVDFPVSTPPVALPPGTIAALAPLNVILDGVRNYFKALGVPCPKE